MSRASFSLSSSGIEVLTGPLFWDSICGYKAINFLAMTQVIVKRRENVLGLQVR